MNPVLFLDIDGVINPNRPRLFPIKDPDLREKLSVENDNPNINDLDLKFVTQIYYGFDPKACQYIEDLCKEFRAKLVISSSWRLMLTLEQLIAVFDIHRLGHYVIGKTTDGTTRVQEIKEYIYKENITHYLVIDDFNMEVAFEKRMIRTKHVFTAQDYSKARKQLLLQTK
ncbi:MAG: hypothetical protein J6D18_02935 [Erysipelotrichaceae bacterium]|nr:hypothetical protein [Erysipelotrichaceae bacterium]